MDHVRAEQLDDPTPCAQWDVQALIDPLAGGPAYFLGALGRLPESHPDGDTFMDQLVHTWDLATATGHDGTLDPELDEACIGMFLPQMPERGRSAGLIGTAVVVPQDASAQDRLLGATGRQP